MKILKKDSGKFNVMKDGNRRDFGGESITDEEIGVKLKHAMTIMVYLPTSTRL